MKEACPAAGGPQDKPSPDSGCSLGFNSSLSSPVKPAGAGESATRWHRRAPPVSRPNIQPTNQRSPLVASTPGAVSRSRGLPASPSCLSCGPTDSELAGAEGNSSEQDEDEEEGGRGGGDGARRLVPETPDQEAFLKEHFVALADLSSSGRTPVRWRSGSWRLGPLTKV